MRTCMKSCLVCFLWIFGPLCAELGASSDECIADDDEVITFIQIARAHGKSAQEWIDREAGEMLRREDLRHPPGNRTWNGHEIYDRDNPAAGRDTSREQFDDRDLRGHPDRDR